MSQPVLTKGLFQKVLIDPVLERGASRLQIVSGFATASMADRHMECLSKLGSQISVELIIGMAKQSGIEEAQHAAFCKLAKDGAYGHKFGCRYVVRNKPVHAKAYYWLTDSNTPVIAFSGSANYTQKAFSKTQTENMVRTTCASVQRLYNSVKRDTISCLRGKVVSKHLTLTETRQIIDLSRMGDAPNASVTLSLLTSAGKMHQRAGLNWGQRPDRDKDQAYIPIPSNVRKSGFFPPLGEPFIVMTDDECSFIFVVAQMEGKALHTKGNNALLGKYVRSRMGLRSGERVTLEHLDSYGRTDFKFTKVDEETYLMDFGVD